MMNQEEDDDDDDDVQPIESEDEFSDCDDDYYYNTCEEELEETMKEKQMKNIENFDYECIDQDQARNLLDGIIKKVATKTKLTYSFSKILLMKTNWDAHEIYNKFAQNDQKFFQDKGIKPLNKKFENIVSNLDSTTNTSCSFNSLQELSFEKCVNNKIHLKENSSIPSRISCEICFDKCFKNRFLSLICDHLYCRDCWIRYLGVAIGGHSTDITCMNTDCSILVPEDFIDFLFNGTSIKQKYDNLLLRDCIKSYPKMKICSTADCQGIILAKETPAPKRVHCLQCNLSFCFQCSGDYHAPTDCKTIKLWLRKCADDSETVHYISANTKPCPNCQWFIEKNGGCNHMSCYSCKHEFCWICLEPWNIHGSQFYQCSKYKENININSEAEQASEALKRYLFYYERWDSHQKSLKFEDENLKRIKLKILDELSSNNGTWIDWQYLIHGAEILAKCRYTLQYTYPYAYYKEPGAQKELFEYQQAALENEIENLAWKMENAETPHRGDLENQIHIVEKRRTTLLYNFFQC